jgi:hypothetical protein
MALTPLQAERLAAGSPGRARGRAAIWLGRILSGLAIAALTLDGVGKLLRLPKVVEGTVKYGFSPDSIFGIGVALLTGVGLYALRPTRALGAIWLTGYLGGAVCTHVRAGDPLFSHVLAPIYVACFIWGGLVLRDVRVRALFSPRSQP